VRVRVGFVERDERVLPDMGVRVAFLGTEAQAPTSPRPGVLVPGASIAEDEAGRFVYVVDADRVHRRAVQVGAREGNRVRVVQGLENGERVVSELSGELLASLGDGVRVTASN
jgi:hypothetical protein